MYFYYLIYKNVVSWPGAVFEGGVSSLKSIKIEVKLDDDFQTKMSTITMTSNYIINTIPLYSKSHSVMLINGNGLRPLM